jgi:hypothetical protein
MRPFALALTLCCALAPPVAHAESGDADQLRGRIDLRAALADGERSWVNGGYGKTRFGGDNAGGAGIDSASQAAIEWRPRITWSLDGHVHAQIEAHQSQAVDLVEAYLRYRAPPRDGWRLGARAGLMYPPVSLEHDGPAWSPTATLTPSAINSWIGEEVLVVGLEGSARRAFGSQELGATLGLFGYNDTSGTLLSVRGWALHDILGTAFGDFPLPVGPDTLPFAQAPETEPVRELDDHAGYYARLAWKPSPPLSLDILHYDNAGDRVSNQEGQWSWETRFTNVGLRAALGDDTHILAQAMSGQTIFGPRRRGGYRVDMDFAAAYALLTHAIDRHIISGRVDYFLTDDKKLGSNEYDEEGWALTGAYMFAFTDSVSLALEALHVRSDRPRREENGLARAQDQTVLQTGLRYAF